MKSTAKTIACAVFALTLTGCATQPPADGQAVADPIEPFNRAMYQVHDVLDQAVIRPAAWTYKNVLPGQVQYYVHSFLTNLGEPIVFLNNVLQGDGERAFNTFMRFTLNSTFGLAGMLDFAGEAGFEAEPEDFGQTLAVWGVDDGPFLFLPLIGPTNARDLTGRVVDSFLDPFNHIARAHDAEGFLYGRPIAAGIDRRARLMPTYDDMRASSVDFYATLRSAYAQNRAAQIRNQAAGDMLPDYNFDMPDADDAPPATPPTN